MIVPPNQKHLSTVVGVKHSKFLLNTTSEGSRSSNDKLLYRIQGCFYNVEQHVPESQRTIPVAVMNTLMDPLLEREYTVTTNKSPLKQCGVVVTYNGTGCSCTTSHGTKYIKNCPCYTALDPWHPPDTPNFLKPSAAATHNPSVPILSIHRLCLLGLSFHQIYLSQHVQFVRINDITVHDHFVEQKVHLLQLVHDIQFANASGPLVHRLDQVVNEFQQSKLIFWIVVSVSAQFASNNEEETKRN